MSPRRANVDSPSRRGTFEHLTQGVTAHHQLRSPRQSSRLLVSAAESVLNRAHECSKSNAPAFPSPRPSKTPASGANQRCRRWRSRAVRPKGSSSAAPSDDEAQGSYEHEDHKQLRRPVLLSPRGAQILEDDLYSPNAHLCMSQTWKLFRFHKAYYARRL
ncbi:hypothetical protein FVE85_3500 [Porphyridium purpureum]|uniref:Uncharacterized protein n=1 Tax=Porphyridium purpureum TaxID=35688 RepID=A0A5J4YM15_PORPP|nr:hypothetical protein FVE85_3500 [Porphyridium purpureum]|eukprot:POR8146..scf249_10